MDQSERCFELLKSKDLEGLGRLLQENPSAAGAKDSNGVSLLMQLIYRGNRDLAKIVAAQKQELDIFEAASLGDEVRLNELLRDPSAALAYSNDGFTALHFACYFGPAEASRLLLEKGAKVDALAANPTQVMPLHSAVSARNLEAARLLLERGAPVNARQQAGWVPLHAAAQNGDREMIALLVLHNADVTIFNDHRKNAAMVAREKGHNEISDLLEHQAANPHSRGQK
jgi:uncharacterized protein